MEILNLDGLISLLTLTALEIILGIDNVIFISLVTEKLPKHQEQRGRILGLLLAMVIRICFLLTITTIIRVGNSQAFNIFNHGFAYKDLILIAGGLFLLAKSVTEIHNKVEEGTKKEGGETISLFNAVVQIVLIDIVFSIDSILTAVGLVSSEQVIIMIVAVILSMFMMISFSQIISDFINANPTFKVLALSFLVLVGFLLMLEGFHQEIPKGYVYFAIGFSFAVELINTNIRKKPVK